MNAFEVTKIKLTFLNGSLEGKSFQINDETSIGRAESNTISITDPLASSNHCVIYYENGHPFLKDLDSTNDTMVNGRPIRVAELHDGDMILLGDTRISVSTSQAVEQMKGPPLPQRLIRNFVIPKYMIVNRLVREVVLPKLVIPKAARRIVYRISAVAVLLLVFVTLLWFWWRAGNFETEIAVKQKFTLPPDIRPIQKLSIEAPQGKIRFPSFLMLRSQEGDSISQQITPLSRWQDGSIRWFQLRLAGGNKNDEKLVLKTAFWSYLAQRAETVAGFVPALFSANTTQVKARKSCRVIRVNTGVMKVEINPRKSCLFSKVWLDADKNGWFSRDELVYNGSGNELLIETVKHNGKTKKTEKKSYTIATPPEVLIEDAGPLHACVRLTGTLRESKEGGDIEFPYIARIHCYAGMPLIEVFYTFSQKIFKGNEQARTPLERITITLPWNSQGRGNVIFGLPGGDLKESLAESRELTLLQEFDHNFKVLSKDQRGKVSTVHEGFRASGWVHVTGAAVNMTAFLDNFWQEHPSRISVSGDSLKIGVYPEEMEYPLGLAQGQAKTRRMLFYFHADKSREPGMLPELARVLDEPAGMSAGSYTGLTGANVERFPSYERGFDDAFDRYNTCLEEYGLMNYGDWYMGGQYGTDSWGNLEYDGPHAFAQQYLRTGHRKYLEQIKISARHLMDVDIIHYWQDGARIGAPHKHGKWHTHERPDLGHIWVEGILDYYHLFGDRRALETAELVGSYLLRIAREKAKPQAYDTERDVGWPLIALMALYEETGQKKYLEGARRMVEVFVPFQNEEGYFPTKSTREDKKGAPFMMGILGTGLMRYHKVTGDQKVAQCLVKMADYVMTTGWCEAAKSFYFESGAWFPVGRDAGLLALNLLSYAYELTGADKYLERALEVYRYGMTESPRTDGKGLGIERNFTPRFLALLERKNIYPWKFQNENSNWRKLCVSLNGDYKTDTFFSKGSVTLYLRNGASPDLRLIIHRRPGFKGSRKEIGPPQCDRLEIFGSDGNLINRTEFTMGEYEIKEIILENARDRVFRLQLSPRSVHCTESWEIIRPRDAQMVLVASGFMAFYVEAGLDSCTQMRIPAALYFRPLPRTKVTKVLGSTTQEGPAGGVLCDGRGMIRAAYPTWIGENEPPADERVTDHVLQYVLPETKKDDIFCFNHVSLSCFRADDVIPCYSTRSDDYFIPEPLASAINAAKEPVNTGDKGNIEACIEKNGALSEQAMSVKFYEQKYAIDVLLLKYAQLLPFEDYYRLYKDKRKEYVEWYPHYDEGGRRWVCRLLEKYLVQISRTFIAFAEDQVSQDRFKEIVVEEYNFHDEDGDERFAEELQKRLEQLEEVKTGKNNLNRK